MRSIKRDNAKRLLRHYISMVWQKAGLNFDNDCWLEVNEIIDLIFDGVKEEIKEEMKEEIKRNKRSR